MQREVLQAIRRLIQPPLAQPPEDPELARLHRFHAILLTRGARHEFAARFETDRANLPRPLFRQKPFTRLDDLGLDEEAADVDVSYPFVALGILASRASEDRMLTDSLAAAAEGVRKMGFPAGGGIVFGYAERMSDARATSQAVEALACAYRVLAEVGHRDASGLAEVLRGTWRVLLVRLGERRSLLAPDDFSLTQAYELLAILLAYEATGGAWTEEDRSVVSRRFVALQKASDRFSGLPYAPRARAERALESACVSARVATRALGLLRKGELALDGDERTATWIYRQEAVRLATEVLGTRHPLRAVDVWHAALLASDLEVEAEHVPAATGENLTELVEAAVRDRIERFARDELAQYLDLALQKPSPTLDRLAFIAIVAQQGQQGKEFQSPEVELAFARMMKEHSFSAGGLGGALEKWPEFVQQAKAKLTKDGRPK